MQLCVIITDDKDEPYQKSFVSLATMATHKYQLFPSPTLANAPSNAIDRK